MEPRDFIAAASAAFSFIMAFFGIGRGKKAADVTIAVDRALLDTRIVGLEKRVDGLQHELHGVKTGLDIGIGRLQDSVTDVAKTLQKLKTTVAVLADRDERPIRPAGRGRTTRASV